MLWLVAMVMGCGEPTVYDECLRGLELYCECDGSCLSEEEAAAECESWSSDADAEYTECYNDVYERDCSDASVDDECGHLYPDG